MVNISSIIDIGVLTEDAADKKVLSFKGYVEDSTNGFLFRINNVSDIGNFTPTGVILGSYKLTQIDFTGSSSGSSSAIASGQIQPTKIYGKKVVQTVTFASIASADAYNSDSTMRTAYEYGYGDALGIVEFRNGRATWKVNCHVASTASRRGASVEFSATVADSAGVTVPSGGVTATTLSQGISNVVNNDASLASVTPPAANSMTVQPAVITTTGTAPPTPPSASSSGLAAGAIAGIVIAAIVVLVVIGVVIYFLVKPKSDEPRGTTTEMHAGVPTMGEETAVKERV